MGYVTVSALTPSSGLREFMLAPEVVLLRLEAAGEAEANWVVKREKTVFQAWGSHYVVEYDQCCHSLGIPSVRP